MQNKNQTADIAKIQEAVASRQPSESGEIVELIIFTIGGEEFAADISQVREVITKGTITPIPDSPDFIEGVTNVRGEVTLAIDLRARFSLRSGGADQCKHIVITEQQKNLFGLMVDEVTEVLRISKSEVKPTPELVTRIDRVYVSGVITLEDRLIIMLDLAKVLSEEDLAKLAERQPHRSVAPSPVVQTPQEEQELPTPPAEQPADQAEKKAEPDSVPLVGTASDTNE